jgi:hypothetical protein
MYFFLYRVPTGHWPLLLCLVYDTLALHKCGFVSGFFTLFQGLYLAWRLDDLGLMHCTEIIS